MNQMTIAKQGCCVGDEYVLVFIYADDVILLTPTRGSIQSLLSIAVEYTDCFGLKFNPIKCKLYIFLRYSL